ncbi:hypothetical protein I4U23_019074 [Adineta vaga]|nr:hypothetical protein I4U23_019074 [Adineta vaga]
MNSSSILSFRKINQNEHRMSLLSTKIKNEHDSKKMTITNGEQRNTFKRLDESEMTPTMLVEYRRLQHELQCQEALLVLMQKLKANQRLASQTNNNTSNGIKQRSSTGIPSTATKLNQQLPNSDGKTPITATKQQSNISNRSTPTKTPHPNQYTVNRSNNNAQISQQQSSKHSLSTPQATRQSNNTTNNNSTLPAAATRISSTVPTSATKNSSVTSNTSSLSKSNGIAAEQHLLNAKLALRKQLEQTLLQIPTPKPSTCDLTFIPGVNGWSEFLAYLGLEQAINTYTDIVIRRAPPDFTMTLPHVCAQCGTDWTVTWHEVVSTNETNSDEKILCDRCSKSSQKKLLKQDHSNRLRQAFIKALQQEKELDAKFQHQTPPSSTSTTPTTNSSTAIKQSSSSHQHSKHSTKSLSTKTSSNHHSHHHNNNSSHNNNNNNNHHHHHSHSHHHHHGGKSHNSSSKSHSSSSKSHSTNLSTLAPSPAETLASTLAALQTNEQMEFFQKHFLSNMLPYAVANQAAALAAKSSHQQQQQQAALAALPAMAASLMRQPNPAQYLLDMIPQAAKQQHHHHHHSK